MAMATTSASSGGAPPPPPKKIDGAPATSSLHVETAAKAPTPPSSSAAAKTKTKTKRHSPPTKRAAKDGGKEPRRSAARGDEPGRKRSRGDAGKGAVDGADASDDPAPFAALPFHGEHKRAVSSLAFAPPGAGGSGASLHAGGRDPAAVLCASASADGTAKVWDLARHLADAASGRGRPWAHKKKKVRRSAAAAAARLDPAVVLEGHGRGINDVAWSPTGAYLATASDDRTLRLWSAETGAACVEFRGHASFVFACKFNPQSNLLASGSFDETVKLWDVRCGECVATLPAHSNPVTGVDFNRDGTCIVSSSYDGLVRIWDTATGECLKTVYAEGNPPVGGVRFSPNARFVLSGTLDSKLRLYDVAGRSGRGAPAGPSDPRGARDRRPRLQGGQCAKTYAGGHVATKYCAFAAFLTADPRRQCVVSGSEDGKVYLYDLQSRLVRQTLEGHLDAVLAVDAHQTRELIGSGGMANDKTVRFWAPAVGSNV